LGKKVSKLDWDFLGKKNASLVQATLFGSTLGGSRKFSTLGVQNVGRYRFEKTGGVIVLGLCRCKSAGNPTFLQSVSDGLVDFLIGG
jgi:hypothetical protein